MKQTNKKEFSKFLNKFEKLLDYHVEKLGNGIKMDIFKDDTERFLKVSHCRLVLSVESGDIILKILFFDKNKNEVFSEEIGKSSMAFEVLKSKGESPLPLFYIVKKKFRYAGCYSKILFEFF